MKITLRYCMLVLLAGSTVQLAAQNRLTDTSATCIAFWKNNDKKVYLIKHSKEKIGANNQVIKTEASYEAHIKVKDSSASGFNMEWTYKNFSVAGAVENTLSSLNKIMDGLKFVYTTDEVGMFAELLNWQEVRDVAFKNYEAALKTQSGNKEFVAALNQVKAIFQTKENIEAVLIKEVQVFHSPYGVEYSTNGTVVTTALPNITGGEPFPATIVLKLTAADEKADLCSVNITQQIDKGKAGPIIAVMLKKLSGNPNLDAAKINKDIRDMNISDISEYHYSINSGWSNKIMYKRIAHVGSMQQTETYQMTAQ